MCFQVELANVEASAVDALVKYCYSGDINISDTNVLSILPAARMLQLDQVEELCCEFLKKLLEQSSSSVMAPVPDSRSCPEADENTLHNFEVPQLVDQVGLSSTVSLDDTASNDAVENVDIARGDLGDRIKELCYHFLKKSLQPSGSSVVQLVADSSRCPAADKNILQKYLDTLKEYREHLVTRYESTVRSLEQQCYGE
ncbi:hypothetical protein COOONC_19229 [Cooperia oncophora]